MKKSLLLAVFLFFIAAAVCFGGSSGNFTGGRALVGLGGSVSFETDPDIILNTDLGFFPFDNFLLQFGTNMRFQAEDVRLRLDTGIQYYLSGFFITPFLGTEFSYIVLDDFFNEEDMMLVRLAVGADLFIMPGFSIVFTGYPIGGWFYDGDSDVIDDFSYSLGLHLFL